MPRYTNLENRLTDDKCSQELKEFGNKSINDYNTFNYYFTHDCKCDMFDNVLYDNNFTIRDGYGYASGCTIDSDTDMRLNGALTHQKGRIQLCTRVFEAVPSVNKGGLIPNVESRLKNGDDTSDIRSCDRVTEHSFIPLKFYPLKPCVAAVQDPKHIVEPWTRGGSATRDYVRDSKHLEKCGFVKKNGAYVRA
jgi:hypothetical protein